MKNKRVFAVFFILVLLSAFLSLIHVSLFSEIIGKGDFTNSLQIMPLRLCLAFVFLWYGLSHLVSPLEFNGIGNRLLGKLGKKTPYDFVYFAKIWGFTEVLISLSLIFGFYLDAFSAVASIYIFLVILAYYIGASSFIFRDVAIFGAALSLFLLSL